MEIKESFNFFELPNLQKLLQEIKEEVPKIGFTVEKLCNDKDFTDSFTEAVTEPAELKKYLINTSKYELNNKDYDPDYVLFFRRSLPGEKPKPEERWTNEYIQVKNGLRREIPEGPHRYYTIILFDSLGKILINGEKKGETNPVTDGEVVVNLPEYDQNSCICKFKTDYDKKSLENYLKQDGALTLDAVLKKVQAIKSEK